MRMPDDLQNIDSTLKALRTKQMSPQTAAMHIAGLLLPAGSPGAAYYLERCVGWLTQLLTAEQSTATPRILADRLKAISEVSREIKAELGPLVGRLRLAEIQK